MYTCKLANPLSSKQMLNQYRSQSNLDEINRVTHYAQSGIPIYI
jgi:hypothetical protein